MAWSISIVGKTKGASEADQVQKEHQVITRLNEFLKTLVADDVEIIDAHLWGAHVHHSTHIPEQSPEAQGESQFYRDVAKELNS